ncbi:MAG: GxxExxY protein [Saprospiraceae bacterium]|jgi:GxxExxY protein|nr:GxxExxY protein [Saprospiraceae bacterium]HRD82318.1 GxxExxY protein [Saprospiraceae bacterium]
MSEIILKEEAYQIIGACMEVYSTLGAGFSEDVYQEALSIEFDDRKILFVQQCPIQVQYKKTVLKKMFYADFVCFDQIIVELKAIEKLLPQHEAQIINYLKATKMPLGLLINFGSIPMQTKRFANTYKNPYF